jgi:hypothetical protein
MWPSGNQKSIACVLPGGIRLIVEGSSLDEIKDFILLNKTWSNFFYLE